MIARRLAVVFAIAFVLGVGSTALVVHSRTETTTTPEPTAASPSPHAAADDDATDNADSAWPDNADSPEQVMYAQPQRMQKALDRVTSRVPDRVNLYLIAFAGDGEENVFRNEAEYVVHQFVERYDAAGHTLLLVNNPETLDTAPLASLTNLEAAIDAVAEKMNRNDDVLMVFLTSHGTREHVLYVNMDPLPLDQIGPDDLADVFDRAQIRNKVVVISACYSGGFIDALKDEHTMVITAAREDRASFGCGTDSEITDFGRAFFIEGLNHDDSFTGAFNVAKSLIDAWETRDKEEHSYPQIFTTPTIENVLRNWRRGIHVGPPVPFAPAATPSDSDALTASR
ncbi:MAG: C13 family peptidase [Rudaea sp.]